MSQQVDKKFSHVPGKGSWEIPRKTFHYSIAAIDVYPALTVFLCIVLSAELLRFNFEWFNQIYCFVLGPLMRPTEIHSRINDTGCVIVLYWFPLDLAAISIVYLSWTDPTASICGKLWGKYTFQYGGKSLAGSLGAAITGALVTWLYFGPLARYSLSYDPATSPVPLSALSIYGGLVAAFSEGVSNIFYNLDDNLTIPVISVILLWIPLVGLGLGGQ
ncbi:phosphatidate cytidylyltransferase [Pilaira anomala]|nr:phosphatidate cytidylyltransferase [Pilaira anomala]